MEKRQRLSKKIMTVFTVCLFLLPLLIFGYQTSENMFAPIWAFFGEICFTVLLVTGLSGVYLTLQIQLDIEKDFVEKISASYPNYRITRIEFNRYLLEEKVNLVFLTKSEIEFDFDSTPSSRIEIDFNKKIAYYK